MARTGNGPERKVRSVRLSIPADDVAVMQWLDAQHNMTASVRQIIREWVSTHGVVDAFVSQSTIPRRRPGRPRKSDAGCARTDAAPAAEPAAPENGSFGEPAGRAAAQPSAAAAADAAPKPRRKDGSGTDSDRLRRMQGLLDS